VRKGKKNPQLHPGRGERKKRKRRKVGLVTQGMNRGLASRQ